MLKLNELTENALWCTLVVVLDQDLHPNQIIYDLIDARVALDSSDKPFVGLPGCHFNFAVAEQVIVPNDTVTFPVGEASPSTTTVVSFAQPVQLAGGNASFRIALRVGAEVQCGKNTMIRKGLQMGHNDCSNAGLEKLRAYLKGNHGFIFATNCSVDDIRDALANNKRWQEARTTQISNVDLMLPSRLVGMDPSQTSFFKLISSGTKMVGALIFIFSAMFQEVGTFHLAFDTDAFTLSSTGVALVKTSNFQR